jgi:Fe-S cluster biogenesis protein NfuA
MKNYFTFQKKMWHLSLSVMFLFLCYGYSANAQDCNTDDPTSPVGITPTQTSNGNPALCDGGVRIDPAREGTFALDGGFVTIEIENTSCGEVFSWTVTSGVTIHEIVAKGGPVASLYDYNGYDVVTDGNLHAPVGTSGKYYDLSHIDFCFTFQPSAPVCEAEGSHIDCYGYNTGVITVMWENGTAPFKIYLDGELIETNATSPFDITGLTAGIYEVKVEDATMEYSECPAEVTQEPDRPIVLSCPADIEELACQTQEAIDENFAIWLAEFEASGGTNLLVTYMVNGIVVPDLDGLTAPDECGGEITIQIDVEDDCKPDASCSSTFSVLAAPDVTYDVLPQDATYSACDFEDQAGAIAAFNAWVALQESNLNLGGGCDPQLSSDAGQVELADFCEGDVVTVTWTVSDLCIENIVVSADFTITAAPDVTYDVLPQDATYSACDFEDQAGAIAAFNAWVALQESNLNLGGGCDPQLSSDAGQVELADFCEGDVVTVTWTVSDLCIENIVVSADFTITAAPDITYDVLPQDATYSACDFEDQAGAIAAFNAWVALQESNLNLGGGCDPQLSSDAGQVELADFCEGDVVTVTWTVSDLCIEDIVVSADFTITAAPDVTYDVLPQDETVSACDFEDQAGVIAAFNAWVALQETNLNLGGGCDPQLSSDAGQVELADVCEGDVITVTWTVSDLCIQNIVVSADFTITAAPDITYDVLPQDATYSACDFEDQAGAIAAFNAWVALQESNLNLGGGCDPQLSSDAGQVELADFCEGDVVTVTWTVSDLCIEDIVVSADFTITAAPDITYDVLPQDATYSACDFEDQAGAIAAFNAWVALQESNLNLGGGCDPQLSSNAGQVELADVCEGDVITVTWTVSDLCIQNIVVSADFTITAAPDITYDVLPQDATYSACDFEDQAGAIAAFNAWVALQESNLNLGGGCDPQLSSDADMVELADFCEGDVVTVTWTVSDLCIEDIVVSADFTITAAPDITYDVLPQDATYSACDFTDQAGAIAAFNAWVALQESNLNLGGGCDPQLSSDADMVELADFCEGDVVTVTWTVSDLCIENIVVSADFTITAAPDITYDVLPQDATYSACDFEDQAGVIAAFNAWVALQETNLNLGGGCDPQLSSDAGQVELADVCEGDVITVTWTVSDLCIQNIVVSADFTITAAPDITYDVLPQDATYSACDFEDQAGAIAAFNAWVALQESNLNLGGGCDPQLSSDAGQVELADFCEGDVVTVTWTVSDLCIEDIVVSADFTITAAPDITYDVLPQDATYSACDFEDQAGAIAAFNAWVALQESNLNLGGGCDPQLSSDAGQVELADFCEGDVVTVTWTVSDLCIENIVVSADFTITAAPDITYDVLPQDATYSACDFEDQAGAIAAFNAWVALQESNLNLGGGCDPQLSSDAGQVVLADFCEGDVVTVTWTVSDLCIQNIVVSADFTITAAPEVTYTEPADKEYDACELADDAAILAAFNAWLVAAAEEANIEGGCNPHVAVNYGALPDVCGGSVTVTWTVTDLCIDPIVFSADFIIAPDLEDPVIHAPEDYTLCMEDVPASLTATWTDNCSSGGELTAYPVLVSETECAEIYSYTFYVEDICGNEAEETVLVTKEIIIYGACETAFAKLEGDGARCFLDDGFNRWGWTNKITESTETYYLPLYAGAALCDISKGTEVGTVEINYYNGQISVKYIMHDGYVLNEAHIYVGCEMYPEIKQGKKTAKTVAPGQYTFVNSKLNNLTGLTVNFTDVSGDVYVIVHAVTCEAVCWCSDPQGGNGGAVFNKVLGINCGVAPMADDNSTSIGSKSINMKVYPNPFSSKVYFEFTSPKDARARLEISNAQGQRMAVLMDKVVRKGVTNRVEYTPVNMTTGILTYKLIVDDSVQTGRLIYKK